MEKTLFPESAFTVLTTQLQRRATQTWNSKPTFAMTLADKKDVGSEITNVILPRMAGQCACDEGIRLRCTDPACR